MSEQQKKNDFSEKLMISADGQLKASQKIPQIARPFVSEKALKYLDIVSLPHHIIASITDRSVPQVEKFVEEECIPADTVFQQQIGDSTAERFSGHPAIIEDLKKRARELGLWNMFLPKNHFKEGAGFSNLEYGLMAEYLGKSRTASEATNCAAPDTGNMEVIAKYGTQAQKDKWLKPLLEGEIRSAFLMTEPDVASSDATNITLDIKREGNEYVLNGSVCFTSLISSTSANLLPHRNGGHQVPVTLAARSTSQWARQTPTTPAPTSNRASSSSQQTPLESPSTACLASLATMTPLTVTVTSSSRTSAYLWTISSWARAVVSRSSRAVLVPVAFTTP
jgi:hypothetical protein